MSLVNQSNLESIKKAFVNADASESWEKGYRIAMQALSSAIATLQQIDSITSSVTVTIKMEERL